MNAENESTKGAASPVEEAAGADPVDERTDAVNDLEAHPGDSSDAGTKPAGREWQKRFQFAEEFGRRFVDAGVITLRSLSSILIRPSTRK